MSVNFAQDPANRAWLASLPGMGDAFPDLGTAPARTRAPAPGPAAGDGTKPAGTDGKQEELSFWDLLDVVNPLQHIPIVNHLYRAITGDTIRPPAQILGSTLFGGPLGFAVATATTVIEEANGETLAATVARAFGSEQPVSTAAAKAEAIDPPTIGTPAVGEAMPAVVAPVPAPSLPAASPAIAPTAAAPLASTPPQPAARSAAPATVAAAGPSPVAPTVAIGPTDYFTRLQNPGGSKSVRSLQTPSAPPSVAQAHGAASAPGQFRPTRIAISPEFAAAASMAPSTVREVAAAPAEAAPAATPAPSTVASVAPLPPAAPQAPAAPPARPVLAERPATPTPANTDAGRKPSREEVSAQMLRALDRYQAAQRTGDRRVTPAAGGVF